MQVFQSGDFASYGYFTSTVLCCSVGFFFFISPFSHGADCSYGPAYNYHHLNWSIPYLNLTLLELELKCRIILGTHNTYVYVKYSHSRHETHIQYNFSCKIQKLLWSLSELNSPWARGIESTQGTQGSHVQQFRQSIGPISRNPKWSYMEEAAQVSQQDESSLWHDSHMLVFQKSVCVHYFCKSVKQVHLSSLL